MKVLVCGGAGYIGSHLVRELSKESRFDIVVLDNLSTGRASAVDKKIPIEKIDIRDKIALDAVFSRVKPDAVFHFCASIEVAASCVDPLNYYENNVSGTVHILQAMQKHKSKYFVFSSTAALFGVPERIPIREDDATHPASPYGDTKLAVETLLKWCDKAYGLKYVCLRYFNACGADDSGNIGECHHPESHLIPLVLQVPLGQREKVFIFGDDYPTPDGTCVRDYVHVTDLAQAHIKALDYMVEHQVSDRFNLGCGKGYSVKEIIEAARAVTQHHLPVEVKPRRAGDPAVLVASSEKAESVLKWKRKYNSIQDIVASAWKFHQRFPKGL